MENAQYYLFHKSVDEHFSHRTMANSLLNTADEVRSHAVKKYHQSMIALGSESIETVRSEFREISSATLKLSEKGFRRVKVGKLRLLSEIDMTESRLVEVPDSIL